MRDATILRKPRNLVLLRDEYVEWSHRFSHWYDSRGLLAPTICKYLGEGCGKWVSQMECFHQVFEDPARAARAAYLLRQEKPALYGYEKLAITRKCCRSAHISNGFTMVAS